MDSYTQTHTQMLTKQLSESIERRLLSQLNDFISRGLIVAEIQDHAFVQLPFSNEIEVRNTVVLKLKEQEYIEKLEAENKDLKERIQHFKDAFGALSFE